MCGSIRRTCDTLISVTSAGCIVARSDYNGSITNKFLLSCKNHLLLRMLKQT